MQHFLDSVGTRCGQGSDLQTASVAQSLGPSLSPPQPALPQVASSRSRLLGEGQQRRRVDALCPEGPRLSFSGLLSPRVEGQPAGWSPAPQPSSWWDWTQSWATSVCSPGRRSSHCPRAEADRPPRSAHKSSVCDAVFSFLVKWWTLRSTDVLQVLGADEPRSPRTARATCPH